MARDLVLSVADESGDGGVSRVDHDGECTVNRRIPDGSPAGHRIPTPVLGTERLQLRPPTVDDIDAYTRHFVDYEVVRHLSDAIPWPYPPDGIRDFILGRVVASQGRDRWFWGLYLRTQPAELIGAIELWVPGTPENRGFWLGREYWGRGLMTEAASAVMDFAFDTLVLPTLTFSNAVGNIRSRRIKEKTGAKLVRIESAGFVDTCYSEREIWVLNKEDWHAATRRDDG